MLWYDSCRFVLSSSIITIMGKSNRLRDATFAIYGGVNFL